MIVCIITKQRRRELGLLPGRNSHTKYAKYHFITLKLGFSCKETLYIISYFSDPICQIVITIYIKAHVLLQNKIWYIYFFFRLCYKWVFKSTFNNSYIVTVRHVDGRKYPVKTTDLPQTTDKLFIPLSKSFEIYRPGQWPYKEGQVWFPSGAKPMLQAMFYKLINIQ